jgi:hypothetical protein
MGKVTAVVAVMHLYGNTTSRSISDNAKISAKKTKLESKLKKLDLKRSKKSLKEAEPSPKDTSKGLIAKHKTIRVLLNTGQVGTSFFWKKDLISTYRCEEGCPRVMEHFQRHLQN